MSHDWTSVIKRAIVTERSTLLRESNKYVFEVHPKATKGQIKEAVKMAFKVDVLSVNTINLPGKLRRRMTAHPGYSVDKKKAIVTLKKGQEIRMAEPTV